MKTLELLFSPIKIGTMELKNRIVMPAMGTNYAEPDGTMSEREIAWHVARAKGGCALNTTEITNIGLLGKAVAEALKEQEVEHFFGVHGGDDWLVIDLASGLGIKMITLHHEQSAMYAADAYARVACKPGVAFLDTGPGTANMASGLQQAFLEMIH